MEDRALPKYILDCKLIGRIDVGRGWKTLKTETGLKICA
jgi:hypothetical protein